MRRRGRDLRAAGGGPGRDRGGARLHVRRRRRARRGRRAARDRRFALERCGRLDALVNNAGGQYFTPAEAIEPKGWRAVTRLNVGATERMTRLAAELAFLPAGAGTVVNVTLSPHHGLAGMTHSSAARAAVEGYTRALAHEWADRGIAVVAVAAGHFDDRRRCASTPRPVWRARRPHASRSQRLGREEEHAWLVALCCSPLGRRALRLGRDARRRARQLVRPLAAAVARRRRGRGPDRGPRPEAARVIAAALRRGYDPGVRCGRSVVVAQKPSKLLGRVRFPSPACETATGSGAVW